MVTPEMLLWLAERMGILASVPLDHQSRSIIRAAGDSTPEPLTIFMPHKDDAQFGRLVVWAWLNGVIVENRGESVLAEFDGGPTFIVDHDSSPDSIRAAAVVAVCRALGFQEEA